MEPICSLGLATTMRCRSSEIFDPPTVVNKNTSGSDAEQAELNAMNALDLDGDGWIGFGDLAEFTAAFQANVSAEPEMAQADFDGDGRVGFGDLAMMTEHFLQAVPTPAPPIASSSAAPVAAAQLAAEQIAAAAASEAGLGWRLDAFATDDTNAKQDDQAAESRHQANTDRAMEVTPIAAVYEELGQAIDDRERVGEALASSVRSVAEELDVDEGWDDFFDGLGQ